MPTLVFRCLLVVRFFLLVFCCLVGVVLVRLLVCLSTRSVFFVLVFASLLLFACAFLFSSCLFCASCSPRRRGYSPSKQSTRSQKARGHSTTFLLTFSGRFVRKPFPENLSRQLAGMKPGKLDQKSFSDNFPGTSQTFYRRVFLNKIWESSPEDLQTQKCQI